VHALLENRNFALRLLFISLFQIYFSEYQSCFQKIRRQRSDRYLDQENFHFISVLSIISKIAFFKIIMIT